MTIQPYKCPDCGAESYPISWEITNVRDVDTSIVVEFTATLGLGDAPRALHVQLAKGTDVTDQDGHRWVPREWTQEQVIEQVLASIEALQARELAAAAPADDADPGLARLSALVGVDQAVKQ